MAAYTFPLLLLCAAYCGLCDSAQTCGVTETYRCMREAALVSRNKFETEYGRFVRMRIDKCFSSTPGEALRNGNCFMDKSSGAVDAIADCEICGRIREYVLRNYVEGDGLKWPCVNYVLHGTLAAEMAPCFGQRFDNDDVIQMAKADLTQLADAGNRRGSGKEYMRAGGRVHVCARNSGGRARTTRNCMQRTEAGGGMAQFCGAYDYCVGQVKSECDAAGSMGRACGCLADARTRRAGLFEKNIDAVFDAVDAGSINAEQCTQRLAGALRVNARADYVRAMRQILEECTRKPPPATLDELLKQGCYTAQAGRSDIIRRGVRMLLTVIDLLVDRATRHCAC